jgi:sialate O-acetylesterase
MFAVSVRCGLALVGCLGLSLAGWARGELRLPALFSDHMVVLADRPVPVWGWADPGAEVTVSLGDRAAETQADATGKWSVNLPRQAARAEPLFLTVAAGGETVVAEDVLIGEVWLGSGQSNMAMTVSRSRDFEKEKAAAGLPQVRMFTVERNPQSKPQDDCEGRWVVCSPETVGDFSATAYFFGRDLHRAMGVPVGLINSSYGGTVIEAWTSEEAVAAMQERDVIFAPWSAKLAEGYDEERAKGDLEKALERWRVQSEKAAASGAGAPRKPQLAVHPRLDRNHPSNLFNGMIAPLAPYALRGVVWYQGEGNANRGHPGIYGAQLRALVADWRRLWGAELPFAWVQLPEYRARTNRVMEPAHTWPVVRDEMRRALDVPRTGMAVALGLGEADDIHPRDKQSVGARLAAWALGTVYKLEVPEVSGPLLKSAKFEGNRAVIQFQHVKTGLRSKDGAVIDGFAIAGGDRRFYPARARLAGDRVVLTSGRVPEPVAVRYAWADNPVWSLTNGAGLPASPFRTDDWPVGEAGQAQESN